MATGTLRTQRRIETPYGTATLPRLTCSLPGGRTGHFQRGPWSDGGIQGCAQAALATLAQVPYEDVPADLDERKLAYWAASRGLLAEIHNPPPTWHPWWYGSTFLLETGKRHTLICEYDRIVFDPFAAWTLDDPDLAPRRYTLDAIEHGITLTPFNERN